jgi:hypothetical protein
MKERLTRFLGKKYSDVADDIAAICVVEGYQILPWPENIMQPSPDENTLTVLINNDIDEIIVKFDDL